MYSERLEVNAINHLDDSEVVFYRDDAWHRLMIFAKEAQKAQ